MNWCNHDFQIYVHNMTLGICEFMCLKCGVSRSD